MSDASPQGRPPTAPGADPELPFELAGGRYVVDTVLGVGGMATVYHAFDRHLAVHRAVKVLSPALADRAPIRARFIAEARAMARLRHPHVVAIQDVLESDGRIFIVMDLVRGGTAWQRVSRHGPFSEGEAVALLAPVADAVAAAHEAGIVHRDIKPQNLLLTESGAGRLTDFGIARLDDSPDRRSQTRTGTVMGTWGFMPPEQRNDASRVGPRGDVYALGATLWALLAGRTPTDLFMADREAEMLEGISAPLADVLLKATRYRPSERHETAAHFAEALREVAPQLSSHPVPPRVLASTDPDGESSAARANQTLVALLEARPVPEAADPRTMLRPPRFETVLDPQPSPRSKRSSTPEVPSLAVEPGTSAGRSGYGGSVVLLLLAVAGFAFVGSKMAEVPLDLPLSTELAGQDVPAPRPSSAPPVAAPPPPTAPPEAESRPPAAPPPRVPAETPAGTHAPPEATAPRASPPAGSSPSGSTPPPAADGKTGSGTAPDAPEAPAPAGGSSAPPAEETPPPVPMGNLVVTGHFTEVWAVNEDGDQYDPGALPAGAYTLWARFKDGPKGVAAEIVVEQGQATLLKCDEVFKICKPPT